MPARMRLPRSQVAPHSSGGTIRLRVYQGNPFALKGGCFQVNPQVEYQQRKSIGQEAQGHDASLKHPKTWKAKEAEQVNAMMEVFAEVCNKHRGID